MQHIQHGPRCLVTGITLVDPVQGKKVYGDLHELGSTYVFNACLTPTNGEAAWQYDTAVNDRAVMCGHYFERRGVIVFIQAEAALNQAARDYITGD